MTEERAGELLKLRAELARMPEENQTAEKASDGYGVRDRDLILLRTILYNQGQLAQALIALLDEINIPTPEPKRPRRRPQRTAEALIGKGRCVCGGRKANHVCLDCGMVE